MMTLIGGLRIAPGRWHGPALAPSLLNRYPAKRSLIFARLLSTEDSPTLHTLDPSVGEPIDVQEERNRKRNKISYSRAASKRKFVDTIRLSLKAGHGGDGCESYQVVGPGKIRANGGHGGKGGSIILQADQHVSGLGRTRYRYNAKPGKNGQGDDKRGKAGEDVIIKVPVGTLVKKVEYVDPEEEEDGEPMTVEPIVDANSDEFEEMQVEAVSLKKAENTNVLDDGVEEYDAEDEEDWDDESEEMYDSFDEDDEGLVERVTAVCDLDRHEKSFVAAKGGEPGLGNKIISSRSKRHRTDLLEEKRRGKPGEEVLVELELKTIADVGLVGFPNAGKSTLLARFSRAKPRIAAYPFTTLHPYVGVVEFPDFFRFTIADIPGLIEGAHRNVGLGHDFLRHIERTKLLLYVVDAAGSEGRKPWHDLLLLQNELELFAPNITQKPSLVIANKMDLNAGQVNLPKLRRLSKLPVVPISALHEVDIDEAAVKIRELLERTGD